jgi:hypothetical protein
MLEGIECHNAAEAQQEPKIPSKFTSNYYSPVYYGKTLDKFCFTNCTVAQPRKFSYVQAHLAFGFVTAQHTNIRHYRIT